MDPILLQRFQTLAAALFFAGFLSLIAWRRGFFHCPPLSPKGMDGITASDVLCIFGVFLVIELFLVPVFAGFWLSFKAGHFIQQDHVKLDTVTQGWFNLITITSSAIGVILFSVLQDKTKRQLIYWGGQASGSRFALLFKNWCFGAMTWLLSYPYVVAMGQVVGILLVFLGPEQHVEQVAVKHLKSTMQFPVLFTMTILAIIAIVPIAEEILFRGFLQRWLVQNLGRVKGIALASLLFAIFHFSLSQKWDNIELLLSLFILSCFLGYIYERQGSLWAPIGLHTTFNTLSVMMIVWQQQ